MKWVRRACLVVAALILICGIAIVLFPDPIVNGIVRPRLVKAFVAAFPAYDLHLGAMRVSILNNHVVCDSIALTASDDPWSVRGGPVAVQGIHWWSIAWKGAFVPEDVAGAILELRGIAVSIPGSAYEMRCDSLRVSVADSVITITSLLVQPSCDDEQLFASSPSRKTRLRMVLPGIAVKGIAWFDMLRGKSYRARSVQVLNPSFDILINKDKPSLRTAAHPMMPNELLASIGVPLQIDSLIISNGRLRYGERFGVGLRPGIVSFDSVLVRAECVANTIEHGDAIVLHASGQFMNAGMMNVGMVIPIAPEDLSYRYSGSLGRMGLASLNVFLERAEQLRITGGVLQEAAFDIRVTSGRATGTVRALYRGLVVALIDKHTGSADGIMDGLASFITNRFKLRGTNMPDASRKTSLGRVRYVHKMDEAFMEFSWFALRNGVGDVVGF
jgi:hypothetical protein